MLATSSTVHYASVCNQYVDWPVQRCCARQHASCRNELFSEPSDSTNTPAPPRRKLPHATDTLLCEQLTKDIFPKFSWGGEGGLSADTCCSCKLKCPHCEFLQRTSTISMRGTSTKTRIVEVSIRGSGLPHNTTRTRTTASKALSRSLVARYHDRLCTSICGKKCPCGVHCYFW
jgi:hypothetical protein